MTLGVEGAIYSNGKERVFQSAFQTDAQDTTAAGDTFTGYFLAAIIRGYCKEDAMRIAAKASSIAVSRAGAIPSIPYFDEVINLL